MATALNLAKLTLLLGGGLIYFLGQGWIMMELLFHKSGISNRANIPLLQRIPLAIVLGFIINYAISLVFQLLSLVLIIGTIISIIGLWQFGTQYFHANSIKEEHNTASINKWIGAGFICILYLSPILIEPLTAWDAREIWFFHAKMIYTAGSFGPSAGWQSPAVGFSHVDYPNLVPGIAAQVAYILGYWNEYIPKMSLAFVLVPAMLWLFTFARKSFAFVVLLLTFPFSLSIRLWEGVMDGYLALYFSIAMLSLCRYVKRNEIIDFVSCQICLILPLYLKVEGQLVLLVGVISVITAGFLIRKGDRVDLRQYIFHWRSLVTAIIIFLPFIAWIIYKKTLGLSSYFQIGNMKSIERIIERINDRSYIFIAGYTYQYVEGALLLFGFLCFITIARKQSIPKMIIPTLMSSAVFWLGIMAVYVLTPLDLDWQLRTSANRTMLSVSSCIFVACYFILDSLERAQTIETTET